MKTIHSIIIIFLIFVQCSFSAQQKQLVRNQTAYGNVPFMQINALEFKMRQIIDDNSVDSKNALAQLCNRLYAIGQATREEVAFLSAVTLKIMEYKANFLLDRNYDYKSIIRSLLVFKNTESKLPYYVQETIEKGHLNLFDFILDMNDQELLCYIPLHLEKIMRYFDALKMKGEFKLSDIFNHLIFHLLESNDVAVHTCTLPVIEKLMPCLNILKSDTFVLMVSVLIKSDNINEALAFFEKIISKLAPSDACSALLDLIKKTDNPEVLSYIHRVVGLKILPHIDGVASGALARLVTAILRNGNLVLESYIPVLLEELLKRPGISWDIKEELPFIINKLAKSDKPYLVGYTSRLIKQIEFEQELFGNYHMMSSQKWWLITD